MIFKYFDTITTSHKYLSVDSAIMGELECLKCQNLMRDQANIHMDYCERLIRIIRNEDDMRELSRYCKPAKTPWEFIEDVHKKILRDKTRYIG